MKSSVSIRCRSAIAPFLLGGFAAWRELFRLSEPSLTISATARPVNRGSRGPLVDPGLELPWQRYERMSKLGEEIHWRCN